MEYYSNNQLVMRKMLGFNIFDLGIVGVLSMCSDDGSKIGNAIGFYFGIRRL